jgi:hypothetical protein
MTPGNEMMGLLAMLAKRSGENVSPELLEFTFRKLAAIGNDEKVCVALEALLENGRRFPTVGEVKDLLGLKASSPEDKGREVAERIYQALGKPWPHVVRDDYVGPIGVEVVKMAGGWSRLGENVMEKDATTHKAQWRELATIVARRGGLGAAPQFDSLSAGEPMAEIKALADVMDVTPK